MLSSRYSDRVMSVRHEAWIDRRSPRTAEAIRLAKRKEDRRSVALDPSATNDNVMVLDDLVSTT